jgi:anthranilate synthase component 2
MHGKISEITHTGQSVFAGLPDRFNVTRYHSLIAERASFPETLTVTAQTDDGIIMGLRHRKKPIHGVLFHPESFATEYGQEMIGNFVKGVS